MEHKTRKEMEYIIYCDESVTDGKYYSDFFGGVLVRSVDFDEIKDTLEAKCEVFCICETTPSQSPKDYWFTPYRHWKFLPAEFRNQECI